MPYILSLLFAVLSTTSLCMWQQTGHLFCLQIFLMGKVLYLKCIINPWCEALSNWAGLGTNMYSQTLIFWCFLRQKHNFIDVTTSCRLFFSTSLHQGPQFHCIHCCTFVGFCSTTYLIMHLDLEDKYIWNARIMYCNRDNTLYNILIKFNEVHERKLHTIWARTFTLLSFLPSCA